MDRISPKKAEEKKGTTTTGTEGKSSDPVSTKKSSDPVSTKKSGKKGFFSSLFEKIKPKAESKEAEPKNEKAKPTPPDGKSPSESATKSPELTEGQKIKESLKKSYEESSLGKTVSGVKSLIKGVKEKKEANSETKKEAKSDMKKEEQALKSEVPKGTPSTPPAEKTSKDSSTPETGYNKKDTSSSGTSPSSTSPSTSTKSTASSPSGSTPSEEGISSQDIQDIKTLLSSINTTLNGPLRIKDNKPFRPKSSMLE